MTDTDGERVLKQLLEGNRRFVEGELRHPHQSEQRRLEITAGQKPVAVVVGCSDSRVPPEIIFDTGLGDLFTVRVAGNIIGPVVMGSIEYAVERVGVPLVMVLGHSRCGAVTATVEGGEPVGQIGGLAEKIQPAVAEVEGQPGNVVDNAAKVNVKHVVEELKNSDPIIAEYYKRGDVKVVGAFYDLESGRVEVIC
ncbi:MAG: carbonic anhydrase [candidate division Zixibacteria bacterium]|nr:carbonic anhydrase [candidate division Zixibacteria bacterium]